MIELFLPLPPGVLSPNERPDRWTKAQATKAYRELAFTETRNLMIATHGETFPLRPPVIASITFVLRDQRRRDFVNLYAAFKPGEDGMVRAGLLTDDSVWTWQPSLRAEVGPKTGVRVAMVGSPD